jgi:hypothetical protein
MGENGKSFRTLWLDESGTAHRNSPAVMQLLPSQAYVNQLAPYFVAGTQFLPSQAASPLAKSTSRRTEMGIW